MPVGIYLLRQAAAFVHHRTPSYLIRASSGAPVSFDTARCDQTARRRTEWRNAMPRLTQRMEKLALLAGGSFKTIHDRIRIAGRLSQHLHRLNIQIKDLQHLKSSHIESYIQARLDSGITPRTLQNEMAALRTILAQAGREKFAHSERISNKALGLGNASRAGTHRALTLDRWQAALADFRDRDEGLAVTLELARAMGLRSQEAVQCCQSLKSWAAALDRGDERLQVVFGTKGSRPRKTLALEPERLREILSRAIPLAEQRHGRLIDKPDLRSAMNYWRSSASRAGLTGPYAPHSLRYAWAQEAMTAYRKQGLSMKEARAMVAMDLGHGDGRGRYIQRVYGEQTE